MQFTKRITVFKRKLLLDKLSSFTLVYTDAILISDLTIITHFGRDLTEDMNANGLNIMIVFFFTSAFPKHDLLFLSYNF